MRLYAARPERRAAQLLSDVATVAWALGWWWLAGAAATAVRTLADPSRSIAAAAADVRSGLQDAAAAAGRLPAVGGDLRRPLDGAAGGVGEILSAAQAQVLAIEQLATLTGVVVFCAPVIGWILVWLPKRLRFIRNAAAGARFVDGAPDLDLFALRAMATLPLATVASVSDDPVRAWREGDRAVIDELARLALDHEGLPYPPR